MSSLARRGFLKLLGALGVAATTAGSSSGCSAYDEEDASSDEDALTERDYDYIVIGSGAGGGPLACNLARSGFKVLLLEAGEDMAGNENMEVPAFHTKSTEDPGMRWDYYVDHYSDQKQARADTKFVWAGKDGTKHVGRPDSADVPADAKPLGILYPRAAAVGGCTAHNAMIMIYPHESDWQNLQELTGDKNFSPSMMRKYFVNLENARYLSSGGLPLSSEGHGKRGWLELNRPSWTVGITDTKLLRILKAVGSTFASYKPGIQLALGEVSHLFSKDLNALGKGRDSTEGVFGIPLTTKANGHRSGPADYIRDTIKAKDSTLTLETGIFVTKIAFEKASSGGLRATGVHYRKGKHLYRADPAAKGADEHQGAAAASDAKAKRGSADDSELFVAAKREVIVACGAFNTPQLLKLSGIGPRKELEDVGITCLKDLPAVGTNLQDRYEVGIVSETDKPFDVIASCTWGEKRNGKEDPCLVEWRTGKGVYTSNGAVAAIVKRSPAQPVNGDTDLVIFALPSYFKGYFNDYSKLVTKDANHFTWAVLKGHTRNRAGTVKLRSADPFDTPFINFNYFTEGATDDLKAMVDGVKFARKINDEIRDKLSTLGVKVAEYEEVHPKLPASAEVSDEEIAEYVKREAWGHHASCTCPIGKKGDEASSVLNGQFVVHGTSNLRVVDASVFPKIPGLFIVSAIYMVSEKATDDVLEAAGKPRRVS